MSADAVSITIVILLMLCPFWAGFLMWQLFKRNREVKKLELERVKVIKEKKDCWQQLKELKSKTDALWQYQGIEDAKAEAARIIATASDDIGKMKADANAELEEAKSRAEQLEVKANNELKLSKEQALQLIVKAEAEAAGIIVRTNDDIEKKKDDANIVLLDAIANADEIRNLAKSNAEELEAKANNQFELLKEQAQQLLTEAKMKAREIAGDAFDAKNKADEFTRTAKAMKNIINGYGDEYLIPNHSAIDDLANEYDHKKAGKDLKDTRIKIREMIKRGTAAECDYVDVYRSKTAIEFVLDAFNGKVDSILSKAKHDNYGKLEQELKDAFQTVNHNGSAFRNARITDFFLACRLRELKWVVSVNELKLQERDEQRQIKEQMREEEKARREYEKAIKEAEREERQLQRAMVQARKELEGAAEEERIQLQQQIDTLNIQLEDAHSKNERALSLAQQTRRGHVYIISNEGSFGESVYKIGMTRRLEPLDRVKELGDASVPFPFDVHAMICVEDAPTLENELHRRFDYLRLNKINQRKEFFSVSLSEIKQVVEGKGIEVHWTMKAEAMEYRESNIMRIKEAEQGELVTA